MSNKCLILRISVRKLASYRIWNLQCIITNYRIWNSISNWWRLCILEDFNLNLLFKVKYILERPNEAGKFYKELLPGNRKFTELCSTYLVYGPSRATCNTSALINSVLPNTEEHFSQSGIIDIAISDHSITLLFTVLEKLQKHDTETQRNNFPITKIALLSCL